MLPEPMAVQYLSAEFSMCPCWLYHTAMRPCISCSARGSRGPGAPFACFAWPVLGAEGGGREGCLSSLLKDFALLKYHSMRGEAFVWVGELCWFCLDVFVLNDTSEKGEDLYCSEESIHVKQSAPGISQRLPMFTHFSKSKTALSLSPV